MIKEHLSQEEKNLIKKRKALHEKYNLWLKKNRFALAITSGVYIIALPIVFFILHSKKLALGLTLLLFTHCVYVYSLHWFTNKHLIGKLENNTDI